MLSSLATLKSEQLIITDKESILIQRKHNKPPGLQWEFNMAGEEITTPPSQLTNLDLAQREKQTQDLQAVVTALKEWGVERIYLFGSRARGEEDELSDIDLVVLRRTEQPFLERLNELATLLPKRGPAVDVLAYTPEEFDQMHRSGNALAETVLEEGLLLYERTP